MALQQHQTEPLVSDPVSLLYTYAAQVLSSGVTHSYRYDWLEYFPYVIMAFVVVLIWKPDALSRPTNRIAQRM